jgi:lipid II:glycine glycyltransferase (peptidoglycan interpeptide bridge formation enzyme)
MNSAEWNDLLTDLPGQHILQSWEWGEVKAAYGWEPLPQVWKDDQGQPRAVGLVLQRTLSVPGLSGQFRILYVPRGPVGFWEYPDQRARMLDDLQKLARQQRAIFIKIDPEVMLGTGVPGSPEAMADDVGETLQSELKARGWRFSDEQIQFRNSVWLNLEPDEEDLLAQVKQKTRYNIRLAERKGVTVREGSEADLGLLFRMYAETSMRDGFVIRQEDYYRKVWTTFIRSEMACPLIAEVDGQAVAALILFWLGDRAWYLYGMSTGEHREKMPNYLLQWEAIKFARARGCQTYDMWGAPDQFDEQDRMWGVFKFKEGFNGTVVRTLGAWDYPVRPWFYMLYTRILPRVLDVMRRRGKRRTQAEAAI